MSDNSQKIVYDNDLRLEALRFPGIVQGLFDWGNTMRRTVRSISRFQPRHIIHLLMDCILDNLLKSCKDFSMNIKVKTTI